MTHHGELRRRDVLRGIGLSAAALTLPTVLRPRAAMAAAQDVTGMFPLVAAGAAASLVVSTDDYPGVVRVVGDLQADIERVTGIKPAIELDHSPAAGAVVFIGTIGRSPLIDGLVASGKVDVTGVAGRYETSLQQMVADPVPGVARALVLAGSDQRGTIYAAYEVSRQIGVSPWYFWDDVPTVHQDELHLQPGPYSLGEPAVRYRGFFINDEDPNLGTWAPAFFGPGLAPGFPNGLNSKAYARIFEVLLRLRGNYLWPAVWSRAFAEDDPRNHAVAKQYGVVMGTSHEAPMMRGIEEWNRHAVAAVRDRNGNITRAGSDPYGGTGEWSFRYNADAIKAYWRDGIQRMVDQDFEGVVTLGMRGNGDTALPDGNGIELMESIVSAERQILADVTGKDLTTIPQVWTLYKEVQRYLDQGLEAPEDVTLVFSDDNWGNMRKLPDQSLPARGGGYGIYYHYDYVGGARNYKWLDTNLLPNIWEQLNQVYGYGVRKLWMVNVGDMKGAELPLHFFMDYAWNPDALPAEHLPEWERQWTEQQFGPTRAAAIADVLHTYSRLQSRRKPELTDRLISLSGTTISYNDAASPFSLVNYREIETVTAQWKQLAADTDAAGNALPQAYQDAFFELVGYEVKATANLYALRLAEFKNILYAAQSRATTNELAATAEARFADDQALATYFNTQVAGGKWNNFQLQTHIDYGDARRYANASWQEPPRPDVLYPAVKRITLPSGALMGVAIDGSDQFWQPGAAGGTLPTFSPYQSQPAQYIEVFARGTDAFDYAITPSVPWVSVTPARATVSTEVRAIVQVDWNRAPAGTTQVPITVSGPGGEVTVQAVVDNPTMSLSTIRGFIQSNGYVAIESQHYTSAVNTSAVTWKRIPDIGRTTSGMKPFPVAAPTQTPGDTSPRLEYTFTAFTAGQVTMTAHLSPRNNVLHGTGIRYAVSVDDATPQIVNITTAAPVADDGTMNRPWERNTSDNINRTVTTHVLSAPGVHVVKFWMVDPTVVLQRLVIDWGGGAKPSYLGPPESSIAVPDHLTLLESYIASLPVNGGIKNALTVKVTHAAEKYREGRKDQAAPTLAALVNQTADLLGQGIVTASQAGEITAAATLITSHLSWD